MMLQETTFAPATISFAMKKNRIDSSAMAITQIECAFLHTSKQDH